MTIMPKSIGLRLLLFAWLIVCFVSCGDSSSSNPTDEVEFDATTDSGNLEGTQYLRGNRFLITPRPDYGRDGVEGSSQMEATWNGKTWWYHFSITIPEEHLPYPIELEVDASRVWGPRTMYNANKVPVISCDGTNWRFADSWESVKYMELLDKNPVIYDTLTCPTTYVAMATPYPWAKMEKFIESIDTSPYIIRHDIIGHTPEGDNQVALPLHYLLVSDPGTQPDKRNVVVVSGQHPGETTNSWMLTGLIEFLLSDDAMAKGLRQRFAFHIYPAVNPEGVKNGHYRRTVDSPLNTNRAWDNNDVLEVKIVREHILSQTDSRADYFFDLHGSGESMHFVYHSANKPGAHEWVEAVAARHPNIDTNRGQFPSKSKRYNGSARKWALSQLRDHDDGEQPPLSFAPEGSYAQASWEGAPDQTTDWKALGAAFAKAIYDVEGM